MRSPTGRPAALFRRSWVPIATPRRRRPQQFGRRSAIPGNCLRCAVRHELLRGGGRRLVRRPERDDDGPRPCTARTTPEERASTWGGSIIADAYVKIAAHRASSACSSCGAGAAGPSPRSSPERPGARRWRCYTSTAVDRRPGSPTDLAPRPDPADRVRSRRDTARRAVAFSRRRVIIGWWHTWSTASASWHQPRLAARRSSTDRRRVRRARPRHAPAQRRRRGAVDRHRSGYVDSWSRMSASWDAERTGDELGARPTRPAVHPHQRASSGLDGSLKLRGHR